MDFRTSTPVRHQAGFTLLELLVTLSILLILAFGVVPGFMDMVDRNRITTSLNDFITYLHLSRSEAIKHRYRAVLCPSSDGKTCLKTGDWHKGIMLFDDSNRNSRLDGSDRIIRFHKATPGITITSSRYRRKIIYQANGMSGGTNATVTVCGQHGARHAMAVIISNTGRPRSSNKGPGGRALKCP
jgi:type IV fimbrial biogenesis protein FimT